MTERLTVSKGREALRTANKEFVELFHHGSLVVEFYKPEMVDRQSPHSRDEIYVVVSGSGQFVCGEHRRPFETGEVLFAPARVPHRFEDFTHDFATWVFFYGAEGGEQGLKSLVGTS